VAFTAVFAAIGRVRPGVRPPFRRTKENNWSTRQVAEARPCKPERGPAWRSSRKDDLTGFGWSDGHGPLGQTRQPHQSPFQHLLLGATPSHAAAVRRAERIRLRFP